MANLSRGPELHISEYSFMNEVLGPTPVDDLKLRNGPKFAGVVGEGLLATGSCRSNQHRITQTARCIVTVVAKQPSRDQLVRPALLSACFTVRSCSSANVFAE